MRKIYIPILFLLFIACENEINDPTELFKTTTIIHSNKIKISDSTLGMPLHIKYIHGYLFVIDRFNNSWLTIIDTKDLNSSFRCLKHGLGPNEVLYPGQITQINNKKFEIYDRVRKCILTYHIDSLIKNKRALPIKKINLNDNNPFYSQITKIRDKYIAIGIIPVGAYELLDNNLAKIGSISMYPENSEHKSRNILHMAFQGMVLANDSLNKVVWSGYKSPMFEIITLHNNHHYEIKKFYHSLPKYKEEFNDNGGFGIYMTSDNKHGYRDMKITKEYIYLLYSGRTIKKNPENYHFAKHIFVFDWKGNPIKHFELDHSTLSFAVTPDNKYIYTLILTPTPHINLYKLTHDND